MYDTQQQLVEVEEAMEAAKQRADKQAQQFKERLHVAQESAAEVQFLLLGTRMCSLTRYCHRERRRGTIAQQKNSLKITHCSVLVLLKMLGQ